MFACSLCPDKKYKYKKWLYTHLTNIHKEIDQSKYNDLIRTVIPSLPQVVINNIPVMPDNKQTKECCQHCVEHRDAIHKLSKKIEDMAKQIAENKPEKNLCIACWEYESTFAVQPCGHKLLCGTCAAIMLATNPYCPFCRTKVVDIIQIWDTSIGENAVSKLYVN
jgi:hypothetical protein